MLSSECCLDSVCVCVSSRVYDRTKCGKLNLSSGYIANEMMIRFAKQAAATNVDTPY